MLARTGDRVTDVPGTQHDERDAGYHFHELSSEKMQRLRWPVVIANMTTLPPHSPRDRSEGGYVVRRPQIGDALGTTLRNAFSDHASLPDDMRQVLAKLNRCEILH